MASINFEGNIQPSDNISEDTKTIGSKSKHTNGFMIANSGKDYLNGKIEVIMEEDNPLETDRVTLVGDKPKGNDTKSF